MARPDLLFLLQEEGEKLAIVSGSTRITLPLHTRTAVEAALGGAPFMVRSLPGPLDEAGKIVLVRRLIKEGLLTRVGEAASAPRLEPARANGAARSMALG